MVPVKASASAKMGRHTLFPYLLQQPTKFQTQPFLSIPTPPHLPNPYSTHPRILRLSCSKEKDSTTDEILAAELDLEIKKLNSHMVEREEALNRSRELLFSEICSFMDMTSEDLRKRWKRMNEEERWILTKGFVAEWSARFHPLSAKSVKEMVEEYLEQEHESSESDGVSLFPDLRKFLGFSQNSEG